ncbi:uncharacterized protein LOC128748823 isoform X1 [Synchiropus splendidus]|uniref:uncharacterized protein LOC128748823 isoform X1 n=1 Tax=Synchiropus splendidus TaxID=270530 RepID=UPI00237D5F9E|nr:uncharacterized protein LOC128748823 isoform X1 [Synchiropus splendidus]XP_053703800.1 uncharacterized protein LOC128748823 isoform X1 [Synchiropus splendidus]XP_053703801.1 uncharacterized protein LOC128748823 isoform X1 [Synchiropus splendidus]
MKRFKCQEHRRPAVPQKVYILGRKSQWLTNVSFSRLKSLKRKGTGMEDIGDLDLVQLVDGLDPEELISQLEEMWDEEPFPEVEFEEPDLEVVSPLSLPSPPPAERATSVLPSPSPSLPSASPTLPVMLTPALAPAAHLTVLPSPSPARPPSHHQPYAAFSSNHCCVSHNAQWSPCFYFGPMPYYSAAHWPAQLYIPNVTLNHHGHQTTLVQPVGYFVPVNLLPQCHNLFR